MKKILLAFMCLFTFSVVFTSCDKDDDNDKAPTKEGVEIVNGNVVYTEIESESGVTFTYVSTFVFKNGTYDTQIEKTYFPNADTAKTFYDLYKAELDKDEDIASHSRSGSVVTINYVSGYDASFYGDMTPEELKEYLEENWFD